MDKLKIRTISDAEYAELIAQCEPDPSSLTCFTCCDKDLCPYSGDPYNTSGDCLADKQVFDDPAIHNVGCRI